MSITLTVSTASAQPRVTIQASSSDGSPITSATISRITNGVTEQTRFQPTAGPSPRFISDYEMQWGVNVVYVATLTSGAGTETFTSSAVTVSPTVPWIIHPTTPGLSRVLDTGSFGAMGVVSIGAVSRPSATTGHDVIGAKYRVITRVGPRQASRLSMDIATVTSFEEQALLALVDDQTPLLFRVPAAWGWGWEDGYYDVGQVDDARLMQYGPEPRRTFTLPLERVEAPSGTQQADRTLQDVANAFTSLQAVANAYATLADLLTDTRR